jgi:hypothetical protein
MIRPLHLLPFFLATFAYGQVTVDVPVTLTGPVDERRIDGLDVPVAQDAAISVEAALLGYANWAEGTNISNAITLTPVTPLTAYRDGQLLRFVAPASVQGNVTLQCVGLDPLPVVRPDGIWPARGQIREGVVCEVLLAGGKWILMNAPEKGCPPLTVQTSERLCIEVNGQDNLLFYNASDRCTRMGGRLCKWGEFYAACTLFGGELNNLLASWEWIDDSQNHAHSAVQVGSAACTAQRWALPNTTTYGRSRCCFDPR